MEFVAAEDATEQQAGQFFDQFRDWAGEQYNWPQNGQWCPRHWAPCPLMGYNGVGASTEIMQAFADASLSDTPAEHYAEMNALLEKGVAICCHLGDALILEIWQRWPATARLPGQVDALPEDQ